MTDLMLASASVAACVAGGSFVAVAFEARRRSPDPDLREAARLSGLWWLGLATVAVGAAAADLVVVMGLRPTLVMLAIEFAQVVALCVAVWALAAHMAFLVTGSRAHKTALAVGAALLYAAVVFARYAPAVAPGVAWAMLAAPAAAVAVAYAAVAHQHADAARRFRLVLYALAALAFATAAVARAAGVGGAGASLVLALLAAAAVLAGQAPERWLRDA